MKFIHTVSLIAVWVLPAAAQSFEKVEERLNASAEVVEELLNAPDSEIPEGLLDDAECIAVVPSMKKVALVVGGQYGRGVVVCRARERGPWGPPSMIALDGGSFGFQIGGSTTDLVMFFMNPDGIDYLLKDKFTMGGEASVAGGPKGRTADAATDLVFQAEILGYSRTQGV
ncbi:MAG: lipid-binding SYLF domain-containing protein, partial [Rubricoccaceae bacterium]|nr:lipid-binding SYLF domain-containing protein [Rubricoccaceae bacterium]